MKNDINPSVCLLSLKKYLFFTLVNIVNQHQMNFESLLVCVYMQYLNLNNMQ